MAEVQPKFGWPGLQISYTCAAAVTGGQIVERRTGTRLVGPAAAGSLVVAGVARWDVPAARTSIQGPQVGDGNELTVCRNCVVKVTAQGAITVGAKLIVGSIAGTAAVAGATPDARSVIGEAFEAAADGATFLAYIY
jgi:hypothetical protein